jgi:hypothetical protein
MTVDEAPSGSRAGRSGLGVVLGLCGGLLLVGGTFAAWVVDRQTDEVAGVPIESAVTTNGYELAPLALPLGLVALLVSLVLALPLGRARRLLGIGLGVVGVLAVVVVVVGIIRALEVEGGLMPGVGTASAGALAVLGAGAAALRPAPAPRLSARYDLDDDVDEDAEWELASVEERDGEDGRG